jgi:hypothetical protein
VEPIALVVGDELVVRAGHDRSSFDRCRARSWFARWRHIDVQYLALGFSGENSRPQ